LGGGGRERVLMELMAWGDVGDFFQILIQKNKVYKKFKFLNIN